MVLKLRYKEHYSALLRLGLPIIVGQLGMLAMNFVDVIMIGNHSTVELAAASFVNNLFALFTIVGTGFSLGLTPIVSSLYNNRNLPEAGQALRNSLIANSGVALLITIVMTVLYFNLEHLGQPEELIPHIKPYYLTLLVSMIFVMLFNGFKQFSDAITRTKITMWILLGGNILNIAVNYILIYGLFGFPELGLFGAGISTLATRIIITFVFVFLFFRSNSFIRYREDFFKPKLSYPTLKQLNSLGWPIGLQMGMETASFCFSTIMIGWLGIIELAAHQIMLTVSLFTVMIYYGLGNAIAIRISGFKGCGDVINVRNSAYAGFHLMLMMVALLSLVVFVFRDNIGGWFTNNLEVDAIVASLFIPFFIFQLGDGMQITFANALRGISDVKLMMIVAFISYFVISLPVGYFCGFILGWGILGVWVAFPLGLTSAGLMLWWRFKNKTNGEQCKSVINCKK